MKMEGPINFLCHSQLPLAYGHEEMHPFQKINCPFMSSILLKALSKSAYRKMHSNIAILKEPTSFFPWNSFQQTPFLHMVKDEQGFQGTPYRQYEYTIYLITFAINYVY